MEVKFDFTGKRFVVTGASSGIGRQIAFELAEAGASVLALARREGKLKELQKEFPERISIAVIDVTDSNKLEEAITLFAGDCKINGSVHTAGINQFTPLRIIKKNDVQKIMEINYLAGVELIKILSKKKFSVPNSSHVLISSVSGLQGQAGLSVYSASKSAILGTVRSLAIELAPQTIRINAVSPGWIETEMASKMKEVNPNLSEEMQKKHPLGLGNVSDVTGMVLFLLSNRSRWITGSNIIVDGGFLA
ncbi:MAG: SDR family oxidoreductase [Firmicutes bacterium]|nr:SDR family oxidoreductase [Bacillota bacterium]